MTIQSYEIRALDDFGGRIHWIPSDLGAWCPADSVRRLEKECADLRAENARLTARPAHPDDIAIDRFSAAMKEKLRISREEKGRGGWETASPEHLARLLVEHLPKGDPVDIANFCMMLHQIGAPNSVLTALLEPQKVLRAEDVTEVGYYWHKMEMDTIWEIVEYYPAGGFGFPDIGQCIGPLKMPEAK